MIQFTHRQVVHAREDEVWAMVSDFRSPWMLESQGLEATYEGDPTQPGATRSVAAGAGLTLVEELVSIDPRTYRLTYRPKGILGHLVSRGETLHVESIGNESSSVTWSVEMGSWARVLRRPLGRAFDKMIGPPLAHLADVLS